MRKPLGRSAIVDTVLLPVSIYGWGSEFCDYDGVPMLCPLREVNTSLGSQHNCTILH